MKILRLRHPTKTHQQGLGLVEIMVALTISLLLLAGVMQVFLSNKASSDLQNGLGRLQENARAAMELMAKDISMAGYSATTTPIAGIVVANTLDNTTPNTDLGFTVAKETASDVLEISYGSATDCLGQASVAGVAVNRYYLDGTDLVCLGNGAVNPGLMAEGIENIQFLYGEDSDGDAIANRYINADNIAADPIVSIRISLLASTVEGSGTTDLSRYALLNIPLLGPFNDNLMRKVFTRTVILRNTR